MTKKKIFIGLFIFFTLTLVCFQPFLIKAQESTKDQTDQLQIELEAIQKEIEQYERQLLSVRSEKNTLTKKINELKWQQNKIKLQIQQSDLAIKDIQGQLLTIEDDIKLKEQTINEFNARVADLLRLINKNDNYSWLEILVTEKNIGDFFARVNEYNKLTIDLSAAALKLRAQKDLLNNHQEILAEKKEDQKNLLSVSTLQNQKLSQTITERKDLLSETQNQESAYQAILSDKQKRAAEIKSRIYDLLGISETITFGEAVKIAQWAESQTGVRTAFLLAILTQESNLGKNVGTCNRLGDPPEKSWKVIMKPERDQKPFIAITTELGIDPDITPVSCPMKGKNGQQIGWGGAMGPAQFIPSTWQGYKGKVSAVTGKAANPWDIRDAFLAAAFLLKANGAGEQSGEWAAAMRYFSGSTNTRYRFYGDNVVAIAEEYQQDIEDLND